MKTLEKSRLVMILLMSVAVACGGESKPPEQPTPTSSSTAPAPPASASSTPTATASAPANAAADAGPPEPAGPKTKFLAFARSANFGKVDKVGAGDGTYKPDGVKDLVFDAEIDGAASALLVVSADNDGVPTGELGADTLVGTQQLPSEIAANLNMGKNTAGVVVYEGDKLLNGKDGSLAIPEGKHKLTLYVSAKNPPKDAKYMAIAVVGDKIVKSAVAK